MDTPSLLTFDAAFMLHFYSTQVVEDADKSVGGTRSNEGGGKKRSMYIGRVHVTSFLSASRDI